MSTPTAAPEPHRVVVTSIDVPFGDWFGAVLGLTIAALLVRVPLGLIIAFLNLMVHSG